MEQLFTRQFTYYVGASVAALLVDMGSFLLFLELAVIPILASAAAYSLGIIVHWLISSRMVFRAELQDSSAGRMRQKALFVTSALIGLSLTAMIVGCGDMAGLDPRIAKVAAIGVSFIATWLLRKNIVFRVSTISA